MAHLFTSDPRPAGTMVQIELIRLAQQNTRLAQQQEELANRLLACEAERQDARADMRRLMEHMQAYMALEDNNRQLERGEKQKLTISLKLSAWTALAMASGLAWMVLWKVMKK